MRPWRTCALIHSFFLVSNETNGRSEGGERFPIADLRAAGGEHPGPGTHQSSAPIRKWVREETRQEPQCHD